MDDQKRMMRIGASIIKSDVDDLQQEGISEADRAITASKLKTEVDEYIDLCLMVRNVKEGEI